MILISIFDPEYLAHESYRQYMGTFLGSLENSIMDKETYNSEGERNHLTCGHWYELITIIYRFSTPWLYCKITCIFAANVATRYQPHWIDL